MLLVVLGFLAFLGYVGSFFFETVIARSEQMNSEWIRWMFIITGIGCGLRFFTFFIPGGKQ